MKNGQPESLAEALLLIEKQKKRIYEQEEKIRAQQGEIKILNDKLAVKRAREFAAKTESLKKLAQMQPLLFDLEDLGITVEHQCPSPSDEEIEQAINDEDLFGRKNDKKKPGRKKNTSNLSRQKFVIDLSEEEKNCPNCGSKMVKVRELVSERVVHVPTMEYIEEVHRYVYECQECLDENDKPVRKAAKEKRIIEHSIATPELLAHIFISKYMKHTPFYCLEDAYNWQGVHISRQDMCNWSLKVHERLKNLEHLFIRELKKAQLLMFDESPVQVLHLDEDEIKSMILDSSKTKEAVEYCLRRWENLENYINYPEVTFSTNEAERGVKSWVMAKKNFLFAGSGNGARASCFILSLIETAKQNGIAPEDYLRCLFEKAPYAETEEDWEKLLPWNIEITPYKIRGEWI